MSKVERTVDVVKKGIKLFHQRRDQFADGGDKPYHPLFNYFCKYPYYAKDFPKAKWNTYEYEVIEDIPDMLHMSKAYFWDELQEDLDFETGHEYKLVAQGMAQFNLNGIYYDEPSGNEYIFSPRIVHSHLRLISKDIQNPEICEEECSGYYCGS
jgi:hypothetical protein